MTTHHATPEARKYPRHSIAVVGGYLVVSGDGYNAYTTSRALCGWAKTFQEAKSLIK